METYLAHHGILGMKWGVRRYQNEDGTLTEAGKSRARDVRLSSFQSWNDKLDAKRISIKDAKQGKRRSDAFNKKAEKALNKSKNAMTKEEKVKYENKYKNYIERANEELTRSKIGDKRLNDISNGTIIAGRDYFVQRDYNIYPFYIPRVGIVPFVDSEYKIIDVKNKDK